MFLLFFKSLFEAMNDKAVLAAAEMVERAINAPVVAFQMLKLLHLYLRYDQKRALSKKKKKGISTHYLERKFEK